MNDDDVSDVCACNANVDWWWWWCSWCSGWLWLDVFVRSTRCVPVTRCRFSRRWISPVRRPLPPTAPASPPSRQLLAHLPRSTRHRTGATSSRRRPPPTPTTVARACRVPWPTTAVVMSVTDRTCPNTPFHRATNQRREFTIDHRTRERQ